MEIIKNTEEIKNKRKRKYKGIVYLSPIEIEKLLQIAPVRERAIIQLAFTKGLRASEVSLIKVTDIDFERKRIFIRRLKGSISNIMPLLNNDVKYLKRYLKIRKSNSEYLFVSNRNKPLSRITIFRNFQKLCQKLNFPPEKQHFHILKHSLGIYILERTGDIKLAQELLGHKTISSTVIYSRYTNARRDQKYKEIFEDNLWQKLKY